MFSINYKEDSNLLSISGKFDHSQIRDSKEVFEKIITTTTIDMKDLEFICSGGIGMLVMTFSRLKKQGMNLYLTNLSDHILNVFKVSNLDKIFIIQ